MTTGGNKTHLNIKLKERLAQEASPCVSSEEEACHDKGAKISAKIEKYYQTHGGASQRRG